jgi:hypothetical protein
VQVSSDSAGAIATTEPLLHEEAMSRTLHAQFHWQGIRTVCRNRTLSPEARRRKLGFFLEGLRRSRAMLLPVG